MTRNPIAKSLRSPHLRRQVQWGKRLGVDERIKHEPDMDYLYEYVMEDQPDGTRKLVDRYVTAVDRPNQVTDSPIPCTNCDAPWNDPGWIEVDKKIMPCPACNPEGER